MRPVVEINVVGQLVDVNPLDWIARLIALPDRGQLLALLLDLGVAVHASLSRRNCRERRLSDGVVAIRAIESELAGVQFVTVGHWLLRRVANLQVSGVGYIGITGDPRQDPESGDEAANFHDQVSRFGK
jgi:hypothetical protein